MRLSKRRENGFVLGLPVIPLSSRSILGDDETKYSSELSAEFLRHILVYGCKYLVM